MFFAVCYFCISPEYCDARVRAWNSQSNPARFAFLSYEEEEEKIILISSESILVPAVAAVALLLYDSFIHSPGGLSVGCISIRSFVYLFLSLSDCAKTQTQTRVLVPLEIL